MGAEGPPVSGQDSNIEKPKTLKDYTERLKAEIDRLEKLSHKQMGVAEPKEFLSTSALLESHRDELERMEAVNDLEEFEGTDISDKPISEIISVYEKFREEINNEYQEKFSGKNLKDLYGEEKEEAEGLIESSDRMDEIISHLIKFES